MLDPNPVVLEGEIVPASGPAGLAVRPSRLPRRHDIRDSPLWDWSCGHSLSGRIVTDVREIAEIAARVAECSRRGWWGCG